MSDDAFYADIVGEGRIENFALLPTVVQTILIAKIEEYTERAAELAGDFLDERLGTKSGRLSGRDILSVVREENGKVSGRVYLPDDIPYARIQEVGGATPPHMIYPRNGKVLAFMGATGEKVIATKVYHPGGMIEGKHFMRDAKRQLGSEISKGLKKALVQGIRENMRRTFS